MKLLSIGDIPEQLSTGVQVAAKVNKLAHKGLNIVHLINN